MKNLRHSIIKASALLLMVFSATYSFAGSVPPPAPPASISVDTGAVILLLIGVALYSNKLYKQHLLTNKVQ